MPSSKHLVLGFTAVASLVSAIPYTIPSSKRNIFSAENFPIIGVDNEYDYIVVGGGTAGLTVAYRLAEAGDSVAVVEAGGFYEVENGNLSVIPGETNSLFGFAANTANTYPLIEWGFTTTPQTPIGNRILNYARGKTLGGSSTLNGMIYQRGTVGSFDRWAEMVNDSSWTFDALLPYFVKGTNYTLPNTALRAANATVPLPPDNTYSSTGGPLHVSYPNYACAWSSWIRLACREIGIPDVNDFMSGKLLGSQYAPATIDPATAERATSEESFLQPAIADAMTNLQVYTHTLAKKIVFTSTNNTQKATAVKVQSASWGNSNSYTLSARKEIILAAGAFQSPQLLMVSGIGPKETLDQYNIPVIADRPGVGQNLTDHYDTELVSEIKIESFNQLSNATFRAQADAEWNSVPPIGPLGSNGADYLAWEKAPNRTALGAQGCKDLDTFPADWPEIEYEIVTSYRNMSNTKNYGTIVVTIVAPLSRGNVTIKSNNMATKPVINPNWLASETDQKVMIQGIRRARSMFESSALSPIVVPGALVPAASVQSDAQILEYSKSTGFPNWHAACTCRMGTADDENAVVDSKGRVIGVEGLRVVDASSMALLPPGHPLSTIYVMAEKLSADILAANAAS